MDNEKKRAAYQAINEFNKERYERINLTVKKGEREKYKAIADSYGMSMSELFRYAVDRLQKDEVGSRSKS